MEKVIIFGEGKVQEVAWFYLSHDESYEVTAFTADRDYIHHNTYMGLPLVAFEDVTEIYSPEEYKMFVPIGYTDRNRLRYEKYLEAKKKGYDFITYISPKATYYGTPVGENCFILEDNTIQPFTSIGDNVIMWSGNHVGHHSRVESHCFISSHVVISGNTVIGAFSFLGVNATIRDGITIGEGSLIGAGAVIMKDTGAGTVWVPPKSYSLDKKN